MKVLHLISGGDTGGAKTHILSLFHGFDKLIDAKIICFIEDSFYHEAKQAGINIEVYQQKNRADMSVVARIADEIKQGGYDLIHCHGARANFIAMFLRPRVDREFITTIHSDYKLDFKDNFYKKLVFTSLNTFALKRFKYFIAVSDSFKAMLVERGFKEERIFTVYNGINLDDRKDYLSKEDFLSRHNIDYKGECLVGIVARLDQVKDHETFLRAGHKALEKNPNIRFLIAGDGAERERLQALSRDLGMDKKVDFLGYIRDVYSFLNTIDINALSSVSESFPYAILEGAAMKKPVVATRVGGLVKLIDDGQNGYLVDVGDYEGFADRLYRLSKDQVLIDKMGENLYQEVRKNYSSQAMAKDHLRAYQAILDRSKKENSHG